MPSTDLRRFKELVSGARSLFVITGAGVSAESGVPTFRGAGGFWRRYSSTDLATCEAFRNDPSLVWEFYHYRRVLVSSKLPNPGHFAIRDLEQLFVDAKRPFTLATQNIDGLHSLSGSKKVIELHGNLFKVRCTECGLISENRMNPICPALEGRGDPNASADLQPIPIQDLPHCIECGGLLRPHVVWFGEPLDPSNWQAAEVAAAAADVCLVVGTSSVVYPAADLAISAAARGIPVAEFNINPTPATSTVGFYFKGKAGTVLPQLVDKLTLS